MGRSSTSGTLFACSSADAARQQWNGSALARESTQVVGLDAQRHADSGLPSQHFDHPIARRTEDLDACGRVDRFRVRVCGALGNDLHMKRHRVGVRVNLDDRDLGAVVVNVLVERDQAWFACLDEVDEARTRFFSTSSLPDLSRLVAMKMNGPGTAPPLVVKRNTHRRTSAGDLPSSNVELFPTHPACWNPDRAEAFGERRHHRRRAGHVDPYVSAAMVSVRCLLGGQQTFSFRLDDRRVQ
jgi:hypothetical protein